MEDRQFLTRIDACRPGSDDLHAPEMAQAAARVAADPVAQGLYQRVQAADAAVALAMTSVQPPDGSRQRLLARLAHAQETAAQEARTQDASAQDAATGALECVNEAIAANDEHRPPEDAARPVAPPGTRPLRVRRFGIFAAALATAAAIAVVGWNQFSTTTISSAALPQRAAEFFARDARVAEPAGEGWPISRQLPRRAGATRRGVSDFLDRDGVAYDLRYRRIKATLYVVRATVDGLPTSPPMRPDATTGGYAVGSWQEGDLLYVLVVSGSEREYRRFVEPQGGVA
jgi:hypothetical protein